MKLLVLGLLMIPSVVRAEGILSDALIAAKRLCDQKENIDYAVIETLENGELIRRRVTVSTVEGTDQEGLKTDDCKLRAWAEKVKK